MITVLALIAVTLILGIILLGWIRNEEAHEAQELLELNKKREEEPVSKTVVKKPVAKKVTPVAKKTVKKPVATKKTAAKVAQKKVAKRTPKKEK